MIWVCLPIQPEQKAQSRKKQPHKPLHSSWISQEMCLPCLITIQSCYFDNRNKPFTRSRCMICVSCSVHMISTYYMSKGSQAFFIFNPVQNGWDTQKLLESWYFSPPFQWNCIASHRFPLPLFNVACVRLSDRFCDRNNIEMRRRGKRKQRCPRPKNPL